MPPVSAQIARDIFQYVLRDLSDEAGGFYSAEDADSYPTEGAKEKAGTQRAQLVSWIFAWP